MPLLPSFHPPFPVDLHNHSERSKDATAPGELVVKLAAERGVQVLGICEHDAFPDQNLVAFAAAQGVRVALGVEFSCHKSHIIGWGLQPPPEEMAFLKRHFTALERNYQEVTRRMLALLAGRGIRISYSELSAFAGKPPQKVFLMRYLAEELDLFEDWGAARRYLINEGLYISDNTGLPPLHPAEAVQLIKRCRGLAVWAHPFFTPAELRPAFLADMLDAGLDGLETAYAYEENGLPGGRSNDALAAEAQVLAQKHGLLESGGSDSHYPVKTGPDGAPMRPGDCGMSLEAAAALLERL